MKSIHKENLVRTGKTSGERSHIRSLSILAHTGEGEEWNVKEISRLKVNPDDNKIMPLPEQMDLF